MDMSFPFLHGSMRPDPYKRARSRQYQAKHGMLPARKSKEAELLSSFPSNISQEQLNQLLLTEEVEEQVEFDSFEATEEMTSVETNIEQNFAAYALPTGVIDYLMEDKQSTIFCEVDAHKELINQYPDDIIELFSRLSSPELFYETKVAKSSDAIKSPAANPKAPIIQLKTTESPFSSKPASKESPVRTDKLELEDWLDQVL